MNIELKELEPYKYEVVYNSDRSEVVKKREVILEKFRKAPVPGNRPGKAADSVIYNYYRNQIEDSVKMALAEEAYHNTVFEKQLKPLGSPIVNSMALFGDDFTCKFTMHSKPNIELVQYKDLEVPTLPESSFDATAQVQAQLESLRKKLGDINPLKDEEVAEKGDEIFITYTTTLDGQLVEEIKGDNEQMLLGLNTLPELDANIEGMHVGEMKEFELLVPATGLASLAGKTIKFHLKLESAYRITPLPLDDEMAKRLGKDSLNQLTEELTITANKQNQLLKAKGQTDNLAAQLVEVNPIEIPNWLLESEASLLAQSSKLNWAEMKPEDKTAFNLAAARNLKLFLILDKIRELEPEAQLTEVETFKMVSDFVKSSQRTQQYSEEQILQHLASTGQLQVLSSRIRDEYTLEFVLKHAKVIE